MGSAVANLVHDGFPVGLDLCEVAFGQTRHADDLHKLHGVVERIGVGSPQIRYEQDGLGLLHEMARLEGLVDDLHVVDHADDEALLRRQATVLVALERGRLELQAGFLEVRLGLVVEVKHEVICLDCAAERALVLPDVGDLVGVGLLAERRAAKVDCIMVDGFPVCAVVREVFPFIRGRHRPALLSQSAIRRLRPRRRAAWSARCRGGSRSRCSRRTGARRLSGRRRSCASCRASRLG